MTWRAQQLALLESIQTKSISTVHPCTVEDTSRFSKKTVNHADSRAKKAPLRHSLQVVDFVEFPSDMKDGTRCTNCEYQSDGICGFHGDINGEAVDLRGLRVYHDTCCAAWDRDGVTRPWDEATGKKSYLPIRTKKNDESGASTGGHWITLSSKDKAGDKHGNVHVFIDDNGAIAKGPEGLRGKRISELKQSHSVEEIHGRKHPETGTTEGPKEGEQGKHETGTSKRGEYAHEWMSQAVKLAGLKRGDLSKQTLVTSNVPVSRFEDRESVNVDMPMLPGSGANRNRLMRIIFDHAWDGYKNSPEFDKNAHAPDTWRDGIHIDKAFADWLGIQSQRGSKQHSFSDLLKKEQVESEKKPEGLKESSSHVASLQSAIQDGVPKDYAKPSSRATNERQRTRERAQRFIQDWTEKASDEDIQAAAKEMGIDTADKSSYEVARAVKDKFVQDQEERVPKHAATRDAEERERYRARQENERLERESGEKKPSASNKPLANQVEDALKDKQSSLRAAENKEAISVAKLRRANPGMSREEFNEAVLNLWRQGKINIEGFSDWSKVPKEDVEGGIPNSGGGTPLTYIYPKPNYDDDFLSASKSWRAQQRAVLDVHDKAWDESKHPRDDIGRFTDASGGSSDSPTTPANRPRPDAATNPFPPPAGKPQSTAEHHAKPSSAADRSPLHKSLEMAPMKRGDRLPTTGVNEAYVLTLEDGTLGLFKPVSGEGKKQARIGIPQGQSYIREVATSRVAEVLGVNDLVPVTTFREQKGHGIGSMQGFVGGTEKPYKSKNPFDGEEDAKRAAVFDYLTCNLDRHWDNWGLKDGDLVLWDAGLCFPESYHEHDFFNMAFWQHAYETNMKMPDLSAWEDRWEVLEHELKQTGLSDKAIALTKQRFDALTSGKYKRISELPSLVDDGESLGDMVFKYSVDGRQGRLQRVRTPYPWEEKSWDESKHPRVGAGSEHGGEWVSQAEESNKDSTKKEDRGSIKAKPGEFFSPHETISREEAIAIRKETDRAGKHGKEQSDVFYDMMMPDKGDYVRVMVPIDRLNHEYYDADTGKKQPLSDAQEARVSEYSKREGKAPPIFLLYNARMAKRGQKLASVQDGNHRVEVAKRKEDTHIEAIMPKSEYEAWRTNAGG